MKLKHAVIALLAAALFACILGAGYIDTFYLAAMPRAPQPELGRIYPVQWKSVSVYVDREGLNRASHDSDFGRSDAFATQLQSHQPLSADASKREPPVAVRSNRRMVLFVVPRQPVAEILASVREVHLRRS